MTVLSRVACLFLLAFAGLAPLRGQDNGDVPKPPPVDKAVATPTILGLVNLSTLLEGHPGMKESLVRLEREYKRGLEALKQEVDRKRAMMEDLDLLKEGSPEWLDQLKKIKVLEATLDLDARLLRIETDLAVADAIKKIYGEIKTVISEVARDKGFNVVAMYSGSEVRGNSRDEVETDIVTRPFIHHEESMDITAAVLEKLQR